MHGLRFRSGLLALGGAAALLAPASAAAQAREVVSKRVSVGRAEASLMLEFADESTVAVALDNGSVVVDGEVIGSYSAGDELDAAWRALLGTAVALDDGPLAEALAAWSPPGDLAGEAARLGRAIDLALESAITAEAVVAAADPQASAPEGDRSLLEALLSSSTRLSVLERALRGIGDDVRVHVGEDVTVAEGETVTGSLVAIQSDVRVEGEVAGDVVAVDGTVSLLGRGRIHGDVRLADASLAGNEEAVHGDVVDVLEETRDLDAELRDRIRTEVRSELRDELREEIRSELRNVTRVRQDGDRDGLLGPFRSVFRGVGGLLENLVSIFILGLVGAGVVAFARENLDNVAETARQTPGRAAMVGLAGTFLLLPVWVLGAVALAVSVIGIPVLIAWLPLFPLAAAAAGLMGYLAVAHNAGGWLADSGYPWTDWIRKSNPIHTIVGGLLGLMLAFMAANVVEIAPFLGFIAGLLTFVGVVVTFLAVEVGFGAVLLTRAGRRREHWAGYDADAAWEAAMRVEVDDPEEPRRPGDGPTRTGAEPGGGDDAEPGARGGSDA